MYIIEQNAPSEAFTEMWRAAGLHIQRMAQGPIKWLKADLKAPMLEHLSFIIGNQIFSLRVEDVDGKVSGPSHREALLSSSQESGSHACIIWMKKNRNGHWDPEYGDWGLVDALTNKPLDPLSLITDEKLEMTDWEAHDFAVQVVRDSLRKEGKEILSSQGNPHVDPSLWFVGDSGPEWVIIRFARYPAPLPPPPDDIHAISERCSKLGKVGHFAPVGVANAEDPFLPGGEGSLPLWRGHAMVVRFQGLQKIFSI